MDLASPAVSGTSVYANGLSDPIEVGNRYLSDKIMIYSVIYWSRGGKKRRLTYKLAYGFQNVSRSTAAIDTC